MVQRMCKQCGKEFTPHKGVKGNNQRYCSDHCKTLGYYHTRREARRKYNKTHNAPKKTNIFLRKCNFCGKNFIAVRNNMYCSFKCRKHAKMEQSVRSSIKYNLKHISDKQKYFKNLGTSNLREKPNSSFEDELKLVKAEKRRLRLWKE